MLLARVTGRIKGGHSSVLETRHALQKQPDLLVRQLNKLFDQIREALVKSGRGSRLTLVLDGLDRHPDTVMEQAFRVWANQFHELQVNLILTLPLGLIYDPKGETLPSLGFQSLVLPMPKIRQKEQAWADHWAQGVDAMIRVVKARVNVDEVFAGNKKTRKTALDELVLASGGSLRELMRLLEKAGEEAWDNPITSADVANAIHEVTKEHLLPLRFSDLPVLREIHRLKRADHRPEAARLLFHRLALEYNGEQWADVHPLVYHSAQFNDPELMKFEDDEAN